MQTNFSLAQLADPDTAESEKILRACVHCGFCTATCPTYVLLGDELDSPRGRIYLMKQMFEEGRAATAADARHIDRCLSCLSCMTTCPSGVHYMHLVDHGREHVARTFKRPAAEAWYRRALAFVLPRPGLFRLLLAGAAAARALGGANWLPKRLGHALALAPGMPKAAAKTDRPGVWPAEGKRRGRVALLAGCVQSVIRPEINAAAIRLLNRLGVEVVVAEGAGCCGALGHHMGYTGQSHDLARANIEAWQREIKGGGLDAVVITASGCGTTIKDYGFMFRTVPDIKAAAEEISAKARDVTEYLAEIGGIGAKAAVPKLRLAYHSACSMQHGQRIVDPPRDLLRAAGFELAEIPEGHLCCGSAGTYNLLQPEIAGRLRERKAANIVGVAPDLVATGNIGCMQQLAGALPVPIVHTVELLDWATGGPRPREIGAA
ncbi:MAG TPA: glycolate oxidase subunit GlcF [Dongiaceae bacterium]|jgi:glycolate oxidase iron-sulfur subunit|nr:glycolate oxidase subunit GlcF [Dongiaceae bacterium]